MAEFKSLKDKAADKEQQEQEKPAPVLHVVPAGTAQEQDMQAVIDTLEAALADAEEGNIRSVALAVVRPNGSMNTSWSTTSDAAPLVGACALLSKRLLETVDEEA